MIRVVATSDLHGHLPEIPPCDLLLIGGDVCPLWDHSMQFQREWIDTTFREWLSNAPTKQIVGIGGNHDFIFRDRKGEKLVRGLPWTYLCNETADVLIKGDGENFHHELKVYGSPYSPKFGNWAFMKTDAELGEMWKEIPRDSDILIIHGPPYGFGDKAGKRWDTNSNGWVDEHTGSASLANQLHYDTWPNLKLVVYGHIHEGYGTCTTMKTWLMRNVAHLDGQMEPVNPPELIEL